MTTLQVTLWPTITDIDRHEQIGLEPTGLVARLTEHTRTGRKEHVSGFGPYVLEPWSRPCPHASGTRTKAHRCDRCVVAMTAAVFDVDVGTEDEVARCDAALEADDVFRIWYSTHSYRPDQDHPSLRLVLPFQRPLDPAYWYAFRVSLARRYLVPCDLKKCGGLSHFYYLPSCPPDVEPLTQVSGSRWLVPDTTGLQPRRTPRSVVPPADWKPKPDVDDGPVDLGPLRSVLEKRMNSLAHRKGERDRRKARLLQDLLAGRPLAQHGNRNDSTRDVAGMVAWLLSEHPVSALMAILRPSVDAMIAEGSSLKYAEVERMLVSALRDKAASDQHNKELLEALGFGS